MTTKPINIYVNAKQKKTRSGRKIEIPLKHIEASISFCTFKVQNIPETTKKNREETSAKTKGTVAINDNVQLFLDQPQAQKTRNSMKKALEVLREDHKTMQ